jgi:hypothetical protein
MALYDRIVRFLINVRDGADQYIIYNDQFQIKTYMYFIPVFDKEL